MGLPRSHFPTSQYLTQQLMKAEMVILRLRGQGIYLQLRLLKIFPLTAQQHEVTTITQQSIRH